jgi:hypothetical protein
VSDSSAKSALGLISIVAVISTMSVVYAIGNGIKTVHDALGKAKLEGEHLESVRSVTLETARLQVQQLKRTARQQSCDPKLSTLHERLLSWLDSLLEDPEVSSGVPCHVELLILVDE